MTDYTGKTVVNKWEYIDEFKSLWSVFKLPVTRELDEGFTVSITINDREIQENGFIPKDVLLAKAEALYLSLRDYIELNYESYLEEINVRRNKK